MHGSTKSETEPPGEKSLWVVVKFLFTMLKSLFTDVKTAFGKTNGNLCVCLIFQPQMTRMTQILYFFLPMTRIWAKPL